MAFNLSSSSSSSPHVVVFPFMSKGHTIPLLQLAHLLRRRGAAVTIFTTPANHPFISQSLSGADHASIIDLPFPDNIPGIPQGTESTDKLPSMSLFVSFVNGVQLMQPSFEKALENIHSQVSCIVSDGYLPWTLQSASRYGVPRLSFYGMSYYAMALSVEATESLSLHESDDEPFSLKSFPWIKLTRNDFDEPFNKRDPSGAHLDFINEAKTATANSYGLLVNSFDELEQPYADYWNRECQPKAWSIGRLCMAKPAKANQEQSTCQKPEYMHWLDRKLALDCPVLYVAFGSQAKISATQLREIARGLEESEVSFLWVVRKSEVDLSDCSENYDELTGRGIVVNEWVDQGEILEHPIVHGFLSHCGWNSVLEGICAGVPILAWPMMAGQHLNAKMVVEEIKVGLRVDRVDGSARGFVTADSLKNAVRELMDGEKGKRVRERVKEVAAAAGKAVADGGSSWHALNDVISETHRQKGIDFSKLNLGK